MNKKKSSVINLGCRLNFFESDIIRNILNKNNIEKKIVINTCAVTNQAVRKSINEVKLAAKKYPNHKIYVTGCASQIDEKSFANLDNVEKIIDNSKKTQLFNYVENESSENGSSFNFPYLENFSSNRSRAMLQIQQGCDHRCTFCIIPFGRGDSKSLPYGEISKRTENIIQKGFSEIVITGVDLTSYGQDLVGHPKLGNVLKRLLFDHPKLKRLRLSSIDPAEIDEDLFEIICTEKRVLPHLHLSLQSGDNLILKRMKRRHNREQVLELCKKIKSLRPNFTFGADVIVGFPTETKEHFENTLELIKECDFSNIHVFPFSAKEGTPASKMPQVKNEIKKRRAEILRQEASKILSNKLNNLIGKTTNILYECNKKSYTDEYFKVRLTNEKMDFKKSGSIMSVKLISRAGDSLVAKIN